MLMGVSQPLAWVLGACLKAREEDEEILITESRSRGANSKFFTLIDRQSWAMRSINSFVSFSSGAWKARALRTKQGCFRYFSETDSSVVCLLSRLARR